MLNNFDITDKLTYYSSRSIDILFVGNPQKTSLGFLLGIVFKGGTDILFQFTGITFNLPYLFCICFGIILLHFPSIFSKHKIDEELETQMYYLRQAQKHGNFSEAEKRRQWRQFVELVFKKTADSLDAAKSLKFEGKTAAKKM